MDGFKPGIIKKLDETVVNRIAAGEVIQRPANALKEMIENSLDAQSTSIQVIAKNGGLKLLQIQDNGTGIRQDDLAIVCERFTTSKLRQFEDLTTISTYGFRGEALSSISHVAHLNVITKTPDSKCACKVSYIDGKMIGNIKFCAGNQGTQIVIEDLFYNMSTRRNALRSAAEEYAKILDVVGKYAIHNSTVGFTCKRHGEATTDIRTPVKSSVVDNVRIIYGATVAKELLEVSCEDPLYKFKMKGYISNVNYSVKKFQFLLFINHRLVHCSVLRKSLDTVYASYLPKGSHPFVYIAIEIDPHNVDVNVHPTKHEVHFLHEEAIVEKIQQAIEARLLGSNESRTYFTQALLPGAAAPKSSDADTTKSSEKRIYAHQMVRTDSRDQKLDKFFGGSQLETTFEETDVADSNEQPSASSHHVEHAPSLPDTSSLKREIRLTSVLKLRNIIETECHSDLRELMRRHTFVGCVDKHHALLQHDTKLYLCDILALAKELFYQIMMYDFGNFGMIKLTNPPAVQELGKRALDLKESGWTEDDGTKEDLSKSMKEFLMTKSDMLDDYFSLTIDRKGNLISLPLLLDQYVPNMSGVPMYILRLATEVEWNNEQECFDTVCRETAQFYARLPDNDNLNQPGSECAGWKWIVEHVLFPAFRQMLLPPKIFAQDSTFLEIANLTDLYRVFERC